MRALVFWLGYIALLLAITGAIIIPARSGPKFFSLSVTNVTQEPSNTR